MRWLAWLLASGIAVAQPSSTEPGRQMVPAIAPPAPLEQKQRAADAAASVSAQRVSVALQEASVSRQIARPATATDTFFTVPWTESKPLTQPSVADCDRVPAHEAEALITENAQKQSLAPELLRAVIKKESAFYPCAVSEKGALGLMQLMPATADMLGVADPFDPKQNVDAGARFLKQLIDRFGGDLALALSAYNAGPARVEASGGVPAIAETRNYVSDILGSLGTR